MKRQHVHIHAQEERLRRALERSLVDQRTPRGGSNRGELTAARDESDPDLRRALQESLEEDEIRRYDRICVLSSVVQGMAAMAGNHSIHVTLEHLIFIKMAVNTYS